VRASKQYLYAAASDGTVAIRIPGEEKIRLFLKNFNALFLTSANKHKEIAPERLEDVNSQLFEHVDLQVCFNEKRQIRKPSTIIRLNEQRVTIIRGELSLNVVEKLRNCGYKID